VVAFFRQGSTNWRITEEVIRILDKLDKEHISLHVLHLPRETDLVREADEASRTERDEWAIDHKSRETILKRFGQVDVDAFASSKNAVCARFFAREYDPQAEAVDAFSQDWSQGTFWVCPPVALITQAIKKAAFDQARIILICPDWKSKPYWPEIFTVEGRWQRYGIRWYKFTPSFPAGKRREGVLPPCTSFWAVLMDFKK